MIYKDIKETERKEIKPAQVEREREREQQQQQLFFTLESLWNLPQLHDQYRQNWSNLDSQENTIWQKKQKHFSSLSTIDLPTARYNHVCADMCER